MAGFAESAVVVNCRTSSRRIRTAPGRLRELCREFEEPVQLSFARGIPELERAVRTAIDRGAPRVIAGGGDGTVSTVAGLLLGTGIPLGVLPLGSLNHFARDLGIPLELDAAFEIAFHGVVTPVDVGEVNGRVFLNNLSLGLYPSIVRLRAAHPARGPRKWLVALWATLRELYRARSFLVRIEVPGETVVRRTPILFIGNNVYRATGVAAVSRDSLQGGQLAIYAVGTRGRWPLLRLAWRMLLDRVRSGEIEQLVAQAAVIEPFEGRARAALDGELVQLAPPLECRIRAGALSVMAPLASGPSAAGPPPGRKYTRTATTRPP